MEDKGRFVRAKRGVGGVILGIIRRKYHLGLLQNSDSIKLFNLILGERYMLHYFVFCPDSFPPVRIQVWELDDNL